MQWINGAFLFGFAALAVPVLIHLIHSRRYRTAFLGSIRFVLEAMREHRRRRRLRELLLLLARLAAVALLVLLFARPFYPDPAAAEKKPPEIWILLDASGSMEGGRLGTHNFDLAWDEARRIIASAPSGAQCRLAAFADHVIEVTQTIPCGGPTRYAQALRWIADRHAVVASAAADAAPVQRAAPRDARIVLITDLQASGLPAEPLEHWPLDLPVEIAALPAAGDWNAAITDVAPAGEFFAPQTELVVQLKFSGKVPEKTRRVSIEIEGEALTADATARDNVLRLPWHPSQPGLFRGTARLDSDDAWPRDNARPFAFVLAPTLPVLLVDGAPGTTPYEEETYYLETALTVSDSGDHRSQFRTERRTELGDPKDKSIIALCNLPGLSDEETELLSAAVRKGTGLVYFLGDRCDEKGYQKLREKGLFPAEVHALDAPLTRPIFDWNTDHAALAMFRGDPGALSRIRFRESFQLSPAPGAVVMARQSDGNPALLTASLGKGRIVVVGNPADRDWTDWPQERIYLPVVRELFRYVDQTQQDYPAIERVAQGLWGSRAAGFYPISRRGIRRTGTAPARRGLLPAWSRAPGGPNYSATLPRNRWSYSTRAR